MKTPGRLLRLLWVLVFSVLGPAQAWAQGGPARAGKWDTPLKWPIVGIHAAVLPTGEVFHLTYLDEITERETAATLWNPETGKFTDISPGYGNMFCSGQSFLPSGELFIAGGYSPDRCIAQGTAETYVFDPFTREWRETGVMRKFRFYPAMVSLGDGRQLIIAGQGEFCQYIPIMETFDLVEGLRPVRGPKMIMRDYPRAFLLSSGEIAQVMPESRTALLDPEMTSWELVAGTKLDGWRHEGAAFYVPGRTDELMICGGYQDRVELSFTNPTATCEKIDFSAREPEWREAAPMRQARGDVNAVLLPDGTVLIVGGGEEHRYESPYLNPELYDPETDTWRLAAPQQYGRMYHSTAVLLPDGRVLSAGQDDQDHHSGRWGEIYNPPYLFRGKRPVFRRAPEGAGYGERLKLKVKRADRIEKVVLMGLSSVTHSTNVGQRYVPLEFKLRGRTTLRARMTDNPNLAPPGYYLLFVVNEKGVPSVAKIVRVG